MMPVMLCVVCAFVPCLCYSGLIIKERGLSMKKGMHLVLE